MAFSGPILIIRNQGADIHLPLKKWKSYCQNLEQPVMEWT